MEKKSEFYDKSSFAGDLVMKWAFQYASAYHQEEPGFQNLPPIPKRSEYELSFSKLKSEWAEQRSSENPKFIKAVLKTFGWEYTKLVIPEVVSVCLLLFQATMIMLIIDFLKDDNSTLYSAIAYCFSFAIGAVVAILFSNYSLFHVLLLVNKAKNLIVLLIFEESLSFCTYSLNQGDVCGKVLNTACSDMELLDLLVDSAFIWGVPILVIAGSIEVYLIFGVAGVLGIAVSVLHLPLIFFLNKFEMKTRIGFTKFSDARIKLITNLIEGIKTVKMLGWERPYLEKIFEERRKEVSGLRKNANVTVSMELMYLGGVGLIIFTTLGTHVFLLGNELESGATFATISILALVHLFVIFLFESGIRSVFMLGAACKRITEVLLSPRVPQTERVSSSDLKLNQASFSWGSAQPSETDSLREETPCVLKDINFSAKDSQLIGVVGPVGCGKSTLLSAILSEIPVEEGTLEVSDSVSVCPEKPWLVSGTIKENILMGKPLDWNFYSKVLGFCALDKDIQAFENKDETIVGDRGATLSGGQKARVSLARAIYADKSVLLLDDPLSAVDPEVSEHIFKSIKKLNKTVVLVTHQLRFLNEVDKVLVLIEGKQMFFGTYKELKEREDLQEYLGELLSSHSSSHKESQSVQHVSEETFEVEEEEKASGAIPFGVYSKYLKYGFYSWVVILVVGLVVLLSQAVLSGVYLWSGKWVDSSDQDSYSFLEISGVILGTLYVLCCLRLASVYNGVLTCNKNLHNEAIQKTAETKTSFFDSNPSGRVVNRFTKDTSILDETLAISYLNSVNTSTIMLGNLITIVIIFPANLAVCLIWGVLTYIVIKWFFSLSKEFRRIELVSKGPLLTHLIATLEGLVSIRCLGLQSFFRDKIQNAAACNYRAYFMYQTMLRPIQLYAELFASLVIIANVVFLVSLKGMISAEMAGVSISLTVSAMGIASIWAKALVETDNYMASPQRLIEYSELPSEGPLETSNSFQINQGKIEFLNVSMRYKKDLSLALKELSFLVPPGVKVGVVGRTGAGKSSLLQVLLRLCEPCEGSVLIDNQDYRQAGLHQLRRQISVIPQEAFLFKASVRDNLDPLQEYSEGEIQSVLRDLRLEFLVGELDKDLKDSSLNLSAGQKQLLCLARAVLRNNKIVIMDEATANLDLETDKFIQNKLKEKFANATILVIAHRVRSVVNSDLILVMEKGSCKELDTPSKLAEDSSSLFHNIIKHSGANESNYLFERLLAASNTN